MKKRSLINLVFFFFFILFLIPGSVNASTLSERKIKDFKNKLENLKIYKNLKIDKNLNVMGHIFSDRSAVKIKGKLNVSGRIKALSNIDIRGALKNNDTDEAVTVEDDFLVTGDSQFQGDVTLPNGAISNNALAGGIPYSKLDLENSIVNKDLVGNIAYSKLNLTDSVTNDDLAGNIAYAKLLLSNSVTNDDLAGSIAYSKLNLNNAITNDDLAGNITYSKLNLNNSVTNDDLAGSIAYGKLLLNNSVTNDDLAGSIAYSKLSLTGAVTNGDLAGSISNDKINDDLTINGGVIDDTPIGGTTASSVNANKLTINDEIRSLPEMRQIPQDNSITSAASVSAGKDISMTLGADGYPIISYYYGATNSCRVFHCTNYDCSTGSENIVDSTAESCLESSIAIGSDGYPVLSYQLGGASDDLRVAKCNDEACAGGDETITDVDTTGDVGNWSSVTTGTDSFPIISYFDATNNNLKVYHCSNISCSAGTASTVDNSGLVNGYTSITIGSDGYPVISYYYNNNDLNVAKCNDIACTGGDETITTIVAPNDAGKYSSITIGDNGYPFISFHCDPSDNLRAYNCLNNDCSNGNERILDDTGETGFNTSVTINQNNYPVISYTDSLTNLLKVFICDSITCTGGNYKTLDTSVADSPTAITMGVDGNPVIAYFNIAGDTLKVVKAGNPFFTDYWTRR